ncbi:MAG: WD40 repeat domain-containing serine/threonine protein kinase [Planctomycetota bacterium]
MTSPCPDDAAIARAAADPAAETSVLAHAEACPRCVVRLEQAFRSDTWVSELGRVAERAPSPPGIQVLREVSRGGQGIVYAARQVATDRDVALKVLLHGRWASLEQRARMEREARLAARLRHPNVVQVYDFGTLDDGPHFLVLEWVAGEALDRHLADVHARGQAGDAATLDEVLNLFDAVAAGVEAAHDEGILHRDLKPSNVLVDERGSPRLIDFGLAKEVDSTSAGLTESGRFLGSLIWAAPEQVHAQGVVDRRTDVHGLGLLLHYALTGKPPHDRTSSISELVRRISRKAMPPPSREALVPGVGLALDRVVARALDKAPARRYASVGELRDALRAARTQRTTAAMWIRSRARELATCAALLSAGLAAWHWSRSQHEARAAASLDATIRNLRLGVELHGVEEDLWSAARVLGVDAPRLTEDRWHRGDAEHELGWLLRELYARSGWTWAADLSGSERIRSVHCVRGGLAVSRSGTGVEIWSLPPRKVLRRLASSVSAPILKADPTGRWLVAHGSTPGKRLAVWDLDSERAAPVRELDVEAVGVGFLPKGELLVGVEEGGLEVWNLERGERTRALPRPAGICREVEGTRFLSASPAGRIAFDSWAGCGNHYLALVELQDERYQVENMAWSRPVHFLDEDGVCISLAHSPARLPLELRRTPEITQVTMGVPNLKVLGAEGRVYLRGHGGGRVDCIDVRPGSILDQTFGHSTDAGVMGNLRGGGLILTGGAAMRARAWVPLRASWHTVHLLMPDPPVGGLPLGGLHDVAFLPSGELATADGNRGTVTLWRDGVPTRSIRLHTPSHWLVTGVDAAEDGALLAASSALGVYLISSSTEARPEPSYRFPDEAQANHVRIRPGGTEVAAVSDGGHLALLDRDGGVLLELDLAGDGTRLGSCAWSASGRRLVVGAGDGRVFELQESAGEWSVAPRAFRGGQRGNVGAIAVTDDGIVAGGYGNGRVALWDDSGGPARIVRTGDANAYALELAGDHLLVLNGDGGLDLWDPRTATELASIPTNGQGALSVRVSPSGGKVAAAALAGRLILVDLDALDAALAEHAPLFLR